MFQSAGTALAGVLGHGAQSGVALDAGQFGHAVLGLRVQSVGQSNPHGEANTRFLRSLGFRRLWCQGFIPVKKHWKPFRAAS